MRIISGDKKGHAIEKQELRICFRYFSTKFSIQPHWKKVHSRV